jgi:hypothetical protein
MEESSRAIQNLKQVVALYKKSGGWIDLGQNRVPWLALNMVLNLRGIASLSFSRRALLQTVETVSIGTTHCCNYVHKERIVPQSTVGQ